MHVHSHRVSHYIAKHRAHLYIYAHVKSCIRCDWLNFFGLDPKKSYPLIHDGVACIILRIYMLLALFNRCVSKLIRFLVVVKKCPD